VNKQNLGKVIETFSDLNLLDHQFIESESSGTHSSVGGCFENDLSQSLINDENVTLQETSHIFISLVDDGIFHISSILNLVDSVRISVTLVVKLGLNHTQTWLGIVIHFSDESSEFNILGFELLSWSLHPGIVITLFFSFLNILVRSISLEFSLGWE
jgi:hypothetical protein